MTSGSRCWTNDVSPFQNVCCISVCWLKMEKCTAFKVFGVFFPSRSRHHLSMEVGVITWQIMQQKSWVGTDFDSKSILVEYWWGHCIQQLKYSNRKIKFPVWYKSSTDAHIPLESRPSPPESLLHNSGCERPQSSTLSASYPISPCVTTAPPEVMADITSVCVCMYVCICFHDRHTDYLGWIQSVVSWKIHVIGQFKF